MQTLKNDRLRKRILEEIGRHSNTIGIEITTYCPLDCVYCTRKFNERKDRNLSWEKYQELLKKIDGYDRVVICGIGEPFVYPYIYDVLDSLKNKKVVLITSGTVKIDFDRLKNSSCIEVLIFSVDAPSEEGMKKVASAYNWENLLYNLEHARGFTRMINCTVTNETIRTLPDLAMFAIQNNLSAVSYTLDIRRTEDGLEVEAREILEKTKNIAKQNRLVFMDNSTNFKCMSWGNLVHYINISGEVFPCCQGVNSKYVVGNVFEKSLDDIFKGGKYLNFLEGHVCFEGCKIYSDRESLVAKA